MPLLAAGHRRHATIVCSGGDRQELLLVQQGELRISVPSRDLESGPSESCPCDLRCVATVEKDVKRMSTKFLKECMKIDEFAAGLYTNDVFSSLKTDNELIKTHLSLLLQVIAMEYVENFQQMIKYTSGGDALSIKEQVDAAITTAFDSSLSEIFPKPSVMDNVYYIVGYLGGQAQKHAKLMAEGSSKQSCLLHISSARFKSRRDDGDKSAVLELIADPSVPTTMVQKKRDVQGVEIR